MIYIQGFILLFECENKWKGSLMVLKVYLCDLLKTIFGNGMVELTFKKLVKKHIGYPMPFTEILWKDIFLSDFLVQNKSTCTNPFTPCFDRTFFYPFSLQGAPGRVDFYKGIWNFPSFDDKKMLFFVEWIFGSILEGFASNFLFYHFPFKEIFGDMI